jgi:outer membrane protein
MQKVRPMSNRFTTSAAVCALILAAPAFAPAQSSLPDAPATHLFAAAQQMSAPATQIPAPTTPQSTPAANANTVQAGQPGAGPSLTIEQAEQMALRNNPNISVARLLALAQGQVTREARSAELPMATGNLTAVDAHTNSRITGGGTLTSSRMLNKAGAGLTISQLITDFGRTHNLVKSAQSNARAELENQRATELDIKLAVDQAFYQALTTQAVLKVAQQTLAQRQATGDQVGALTKANVKSELDLSFANVQISEANLLLLDAKNNEQVAMAALNNVLGSEQDLQYTLIDETSGNIPPAPTDSESLVDAAFRQRPDLASLNDRYRSAQQYATAERDQEWLPSISALASGGGTPVRDDLIQSSWYLGAGVNMSVPVFNGFLYNAETKEARFRASAAQEQVRNLRDIIARDVRTAVLSAQTAYQRIGVTQGLLDQANLALDLAQARYKIGLSSIVELTQAQLAQTQAEIENTNARYSYQTALAELRYELGQ